MRIPTPASWKALPNHPVSALSPLVEGDALVVLEALVAALEVARVLVVALVVDLVVQGRVKPVGTPGTQMDSCLLASFHLLNAVWIAALTGMPLVGALPLVATATIVVNWATLSLSASLLRPLLLLIIVRGVVVFDHHGTLRTAYALKETPKSCRHFGFGCFGLRLFSVWFRAIS